MEWRRGFDPVSSNGPLSELGFAIVSTVCVLLNLDSSNGRACEMSKSPGAVAPLPTLKLASFGSLRGCKGDPKGSAGHLGAPEPNGASRGSRFRGCLPLSMPALRCLGNTNSPLAAMRMAMNARAPGEQRVAQRDLARSLKGYMAMGTDARSAPMRIWKMQQANCMRMQQQQTGETRKHITNVHAVR